MKYKLDVKSFVREYCIRQHRIPPVEVKKMWEMVVGLCCLAYKKGLNGAEFAMPVDIPILQDDDNIIPLQ